MVLVYNTHRLNFEIRLMIGFVGIHAIDRIQQRAIRQIKMRIRQINRRICRKEKKNPCKHLIRPKSNKLTKMTRVNILQTFRRTIIPNRWTIALIIRIHSSRFQSIVRRRIIPLKKKKFQICTYFQT